MASYKIRKGNHYSTCFIPKLTTTSHLKFEVIFTDSVFYFPINSDSEDWSKVYGMSDSWSYHHNNSARVAWRIKNNQIEVCPYVYAYGERFTGPISVVEPNVVIPMSIELIEDSYYITINGVRTRMPRLVKRYKGLKYILKPYFGGDNVAPHDTTIIINRI